MKTPFRIKICGITNPTDARLAAASGADAIGLNFYAKSPRFVTGTRAAEIVQALPANVARVGVFVNEAIETIIQLASTVPLDWIQLHGDEPPATLAELAPHRVIRAFRCSPENVSAALDWLVEAERIGTLPAALLIDAFQPGQFGGTGRTVDVSVLHRFRTAQPTIPLILAGGLTPENVHTLIQSTLPDGVDVASGVEAEPGKKDAERTAKFIEMAKQGLGNCHSI